MKRAGLFLAAGIATYLLIFFANFPASKALGYLQQRYPGLLVQSVSGSIFSGRVERIEVAGVTAGPVRWSFRPAALLGGQLEYLLDGRMLQAALQGYAGIGISGGRYARDITAELTPAVLVESYSPVAFTATGNMTLHIESLQLDDGFPSQLSGRIDWSDAGVSDPVTLDLGEVVLLLASEAGSISGEISNNGDTRVAGDITVTASRGYRIDLLVTPGNVTSSEVVEFLQSWGQSGPPGSYRLVDSGQL
ncbi:MAG: type II secretion system protein N [Pseudomonadota bacterium]